MDAMDKIKKIISSTYEPSLADCNRIYKEYSLNKGEVASVLSDVFNWLAQKPYSCDYKDGSLYIRAEADVQEVLCVHYLYIVNNEIILNEKISTENDISNWSLKKCSSIIKKMVTEKLEELNNDLVM